MLEHLRHVADEEAQLALRAANDYLFRTGKRNTYLDARYTAAERLVDMIDDEIRRQQESDPGAPDYYRIFGSEAEGDSEGWHVVRCGAPAVEDDLDEPLCEEHLGAPTPWL